MIRLFTNYRKINDPQGEENNLHDFKAKHLFI